MNITVLNARMNKDQDGYAGAVEFQVDGHKFPYEMTLFKDKAGEWEYNLLFLNESGSEEDILAVEEYLEENDDAFIRLLDAAEATLKV
ncbi:hypothetical protein [Paenibacillus alkalitolerans]|uniref:hypothetical protein n=1 Tax=Paenibacillus alkalitolerans TaxID=2799335 RepID=UPI0018F58E88|nr:hypothetical protein [Paenibacillus alkalitolerans]